MKRKLLPAQIAELRLLLSLSLGFYFTRSWREKQNPVFVWTKRQSDSASLTSFVLPEQFCSAAVASHPLCCGSAPVLCHLIPLIIRPPARVYLKVRPDGDPEDESGVIGADEVDRCAAFSIPSAVVLFCLCRLPPLSQPRNSNELYMSIVIEIHIEMTLATRPNLC